MDPFRVMLIDRRHLTPDIVAAHFGHAVRDIEALGQFRPQLTQRVRRIVVDKWEAEAWVEGEIRRIEEEIMLSGLQLGHHPFADAARDRIRNRLRREIESSRIVIDPTDNGGEA